MSPNDLPVPIQSHSLPLDGNVDLTPPRPVRRPLPSPGGVAVSARPLGRPDRLTEAALVLGGPQRGGPRRRPAVLQDRLQRRVSPLARRRTPLGRRARRAVHLARRRRHVVGALLAEVAAARAVAEPEQRRAGRLRARPLPAAVGCARCRRRGRSRPARRSAGRRRQRRYRAQGLLRCRQNVTRLDGRLRLPRRLNRSVRLVGRR